MEHKSQYQLGRIGFLFDKLTKDLNHVGDLLRGKARIGAEEQRSLSCIASIRAGVAQSLTNGGIVCRNTGPIRNVRIFVTS
jgi:hypothetical protein